MLFALLASSMARAADDPPAADDLPLPDWAESRPHAFMVGFDFGVLMHGVRVRFALDGTLVARIDVRVGGAVGFDFPWLLPFPAFLTGGELVFASPGPLHPLVSASLGYAFAGVGAGVQYDPAGPFEVHAGAIVGFNALFGSPGVIPDLSATWMW